MYIVILQWRLPPIVYVVYRMFLAVYADFWLIYTSVEFAGFGTAESDIINGNNSTENRTKNGTDVMVIYPWYAYLTNWTYLMLCVYLTWHFFVTVAYFLQNPMPFNNRPDPAFHRKLFPECQSSSFYTATEYRQVSSLEPVLGNGVSDLPWYFKMVWVLFSIASVGSVLVTLVFFIFLWPLFNTSSIGMMNLQLHGINSLIIGVEVVLSAVPCRLYHFVYALLYGITYLIFSAIFYGAGNTEPIYPGVLDWRKPGQTTIFCLILGFIGMPILQSFFFLVYKIRMFIYRKLVEDINLEAIDDEQGNHDKFTQYRL